MNLICVLCILTVDITNTSASLRVSSDKQDIREQSKTQQVLTHLDKLIIGQTERSVFLERTNVRTVRRSRPEQLCATIHIRQMFTYQEVKMASTPARVLDRLLGKSILKGSIIRGQILHYRAGTPTLRVFTHGPHTKI